MNFLTDRQDWSQTRQKLAESIIGTAGSVDVFSKVFSLIMAVLFAVNSVLITFPIYSEDSLLFQTLMITAGLMGGLFAIWLIFVLVMNNEVIIGYAVRPFVSRDQSKFTVLFQPKILKSWRRGIRAIFEEVVPVSQIILIPGSAIFLASGLLRGSSQSLTIGIGLSVLVAFLAVVQIRGQLRRVKEDRLIQVESLKEKIDNAYEQLSKVPEVYIELDKPI